MCSGLCGLPFFAHPSISGSVKHLDTTCWLLRTGLYQPPVYHNEASVEELRTRTDAHTHKVARLKMINGPSLLYGQGQNYSRARKGLTDYFHISRKRLAAKCPMICDTSGLKPVREAKIYEVAEHAAVDIPPSRFGSSGMDGHQPLQL